MSCSLYPFSSPGAPHGDWSLPRTLSCVRRGHGSYLCLVSYASPFEMSSPSWEPCLSNLFAHAPFCSLFIHRDSAPRTDGSSQIGYGIVNVV